MSEPTETSGRPLTPSDIQQQQPRASTTDLSSLSSRDKQPKPSHLLDGCGDNSKSTTSRRRPGIASNSLTGSIAGSSRSKPRPATNPTMMSSQVPSVHYTKTGRISKAKKGLKVHNCDCGRSYTRAEHLRRHQKNHAQEDAQVCEFPNCGKVFYRLDLLQRHQERHNEMVKGSRQTSVCSSEPPEMTQASVSMMDPISLVTTPLLNPSSYYPAQSVSPAPDTTAVASYDKQQRGPAHKNHQASVAVAVDAMPMWNDFSQSPVYSSSSGQTSPIPGPHEYIPNVYSIHPYGSGPNRTRTPSNASMYEPWTYNTPRSPVSTNSTLPYAWPTNDKVASGLAYMNTSYPMTSLGLSTNIDPMAGYHFGAKTMIQRDDGEGMTLFPEPYGMGQVTHLYPHEHYLNNYWRLFHPTFPVVHRPTFEGMSKSPMLYAAMIAIGGQYSTEATVKQKSRLLHDQCIKLLEMRVHEPMAEDERTCDYQATLLVEVLSQYRARRAAKTLSPRFGTVYHKASLDFRYRASRLNDLSLNFSHDSWVQWVELTTWQHLLGACYILESEQAMLLAREPHNSAFQEPGDELPFPTNTSLWDAKDFNEWATAIQQHSHAPQYVFQVAQDSLTAPCNSFQSSILIAVHYNRFGSTAPYTNATSVPHIEQLLDGSFATQQKLLAGKLGQVTPIRALLAVSGESWILSEKVPTQQTFMELQNTLKGWVSQLWSPSATDTHLVPVREALKLSVTILQLALNEQAEPHTLEMGVDMGLYFAALVLWAITVAITTRAKGTPRIALQARQRHHSLSPNLSRMQSSSVPSTPIQEPVLSSNFAGAGNSPVQCTDPGATHSQPTSPSRRASLTTTTILSHEQITLNTKRFLSLATNIYSAAPTTQGHIERSRLQAGCTSLLLWVKMQIRDDALRNQGGLAVWAGRTGESLGELLDSVVGSLERVLNHGWAGWGI